MLPVQSAARIALVLLAAAGSVPRDASAATIPSAQSGPGRVSSRGTPYDFSSANSLLNRALPSLSGHVAVIVRQDGTELYRFQAGDIAYGTKTRLASFTKTISAGVVLALRDQGLLALNERLGDTFPLFQVNGLGDTTIVDAFGMRHGIETPAPYEIQPFYTLAQSVTLIGLNGTLAFQPGTELGYEGSGM